MPLHFLISGTDRKEIGNPALEILEQVYSLELGRTSAAAEVSLVQSGEIQELNHHYREIDEPTDVLSFPTFSSLAEIQAVPTDQTVLIGSILICPEKAMAYDESLPQLVHHGLLHLLGYDHEADPVNWKEGETDLLRRFSEYNLVIPGVPDDAL